MKRFWDKTIRQENGCLEWTGASNGYGRFNYGGEIIYAHIMAWKLYKGVWPRPGKFICHHCDNRICVEEIHLFEDSPNGNVQDSVWKGNNRGPPNGLSWHERNLVRLTIQDKRLSQREIAKIFGVGQMTISECKNFKHEANA